MTLSDCKAILPARLRPTPMRCTVRLQPVSRPGAVDFVESAAIQRYRVTHGRQCGERGRSTCWSYGHCFWIRLITAANLLQEGTWLDEVNYTRLEARKEERGNAGG